MKIHSMIITPYVLYSASSSASRKKLLQLAGIPFEVIFQDADESIVSNNQPLHEVVMEIAQLKMKHVHMPQGQEEGKVIFVLTADTLGKSHNGRVLKKPTDRHEALAMLRDARDGSLTATGFCLRKLQFVQGQWIVEQEVVDYEQSHAVFDVPDDFLDFYLETIPFLDISGAISIEGVGGQFLKSIDGNYETIVGLPMFKIRQSLQKLGFYKKES